MLRRNMIHFMGSDIHTVNQTSYDRAKNAYNKVLELTKNKSITEDLFTNNAKKVINNEKIEPYALLKKKYKLRIFGK